MSDYQELLDATVKHLEALKARGVRHVLVAPDTLAGLKEPVARPNSPAKLNKAPEPIAQRQAPVPPRVEKPAPAPSIPSAAPGFIPLTRAAKETAMAELRERVLGCQKCAHLANSRTQVVFGVGDIHSPLMFIGEAPGADEDEQGEPFVGKAGQLLTKIIETMGFSRDTVYIANILKCRPDTPGQSSGNRKPTPEEMNTCLPYLLAQIDIIQPRVMVALGATAMEGLFGKAEGITKLRGRFLNFRNIPVMPTYHPAYLLRNQALTEKRKVWEDMLQVLERLGAPISEKQQRFFLKG